MLHTGCCDGSLLGVHSICPELLGPTIFPPNFPETGFAQADELRPESDLFTHLKEAAMEVRGHGGFKTRGVSGNEDLIAILLSSFRGMAAFLNPTKQFSLTKS